MFGRKKASRGSQTYALGQCLVAVGGQPTSGGWHFMQHPQMDQEALPLLAPVSLCALAAYGLSDVERRNLFDSIRHIVDEGVEADISPALAMLTPGGSRALTGSPGDADLVLTGEFVGMEFPDGQTAQFIKWERALGQMRLDLVLAAVAAGWELGRSRFGTQGALVLHFAMETLVEVHARGTDFTEEETALMLPSRAVAAAYDQAETHAAFRRGLSQFDN